jgi:CheY-like chemotaxis protein
MSGGTSSVDPDPDDSARQLRHDVRTLIGQISGYCDLLLEEAEPRGWETLVATLRAIQSTCASLVERADALRGQPPAVFVSEIGTTTPALLACAEDARAWVASVGDNACLADVETLRQAAWHLYRLVSGAFGAAADPKAPAQRAQVLRRNREPPPAIAGQPGRLLVVDDDPLSRDLLQRRLERLGCSVEVAEHGRRALELLGGDQFDVVLLDIMMPEMDGYETLARVKAEPTLRDVPVIVLTAVDELDSAVRCIELGAEDSLAKPINPSLLRARVEACLDKKRLRDQEAAYLRDVGRVTAAAADIEAAIFDPASLADLAVRPDALGQLVRVVQGVADAYARQALLAEENARLLGVLREQVDELERSRRLIATGEERLRQDVAERLHSRVQNHLLLAWYRLEDSRELLPEDPARAGALLAEVSQQLQDIRERDVREVSHLLHPSIIQVGLVPALERLAEDFEPQFHVELAVDEAVARLDDPENNRLPEPIRLAAYRVLEEALGNTARHAQAHVAAISLKIRDEHLAVRVQDDGLGFDAAGVRAGLGLSSIAARVGCVGGSWQVSSERGHGTAVEAWLPLYDRPGEAGGVDTKRLS